MSLTKQDKEDIRMIIRDELSESDTGKQVWKNHDDLLKFKTMGGVISFVWGVIVIAVSGFFAYITKK